jgi:glycosyltransferase involved in cell wall biosynthesis
MKILHITNTFSEGGVDTLLLNLLPNLKSLGVDVELLVLNKNEIALVSKLRECGITVHLGRFANIRAIRNIGFIRKYLQKYDLVHAHLFPIQYFVVLASLFLKKKAILITTEHGCTNKRRKYGLLRNIERFIYRRYSKVVCVSNASQKNLEDWVGIQNTYMIYNGINLQKIQQAKPYYKKELNIPEDSKVVIMVARFFNQKDHKTVIKAVTLLDQKIHVLFCGSGEDGINECCHFAHTLGVDRRIHFLGNRVDIPQLLKSSDIAVLSSFYEGFSISLLEYMAAGLPVIGTDVDGTHELLQNHGILFPIGDYECLAKEITKLSEDKKYYDEITEKCHNRVKDFNEDVMANNHEKLYQELSLCKTN